MSAALLLLGGKSDLFLKLYEFQKKYDLIYPRMFSQYLATESSADVNQLKICFTVSIAVKPGDLEMPITQVDGFSRVSHQLHHPVDPGIAGSFGRDRVQLSES